MTSPPPSPIVRVLGSINMDLVLRVPRFPRPGETIASFGMTRHPGGKGANQAVAAARAGASVTMMGAVGADADGEVMRQTLERERIECSDVRTIAAAATGTAIILVDDTGENQIVVSGGANLLVEPGAPGPASVYLCQLESPLGAVGAFLEGRSPGSTAILNAAPYRADAVPLFAHADLVVLNETELAAYAGGRGLDLDEAQIAASARGLLTRDTQRIVVTLGKEGSIIVGRDQTLRTLAERVDVVDTTGAGDCFCGYLAARMAAGAPLAHAVADAHRAAALAVTRAGAIASISHLFHSTVTLAQ